jgi:hypothetical protein
MKDEFLLWTTEAFYSKIIYDCKRDAIVILICSATKFKVLSLMK